MALQLRSMNHVSLLCHDVRKCRHFYRDVLGFEEIKRPDSFDFDGSWLWGYGVGLHLIHSPKAVQQRSTELDPKSDHLSFQADDLGAVMAALRGRGIHFINSTVVEAGIEVQQIFFHDPSGFMIEVCNCDVLPICPVRRRTTTEPELGLASPHVPRHLQPSRDSMDDSSDSLDSDLIHLHGGVAR